MNLEALRRRSSRARLLAAAALLPLLLSLGSCAKAAPGGASLLTRASTDGTLDPDSAGPGIPEDTAAGSYLAGRFALDAGEFGEAADSFDRALAEDPQNAELRRQVFLLRLAEGDFKRALAVAGALAELDAGADEALLLLALDRAKAGDFAQARTTLERIGEEGAIGLVLPVLNAWALFATKAVEPGLALLDPGGSGQGLDLLRLYHRALMLDAAGRPGEAVPLLAGRSWPDGPPLRIVQTLAQLHLHQGDAAAARKVTADALAQNPDDPQLLAADQAVRAGASRIVPVSTPADAMADALIGVGEALNEQQAGSQALLLARAASFLSPQLADTKLLIDRILIAQGNQAAADKALAEIPAEAPQSWAARLLRAEALSAQDRGGEAARLLRAMAGERPERTDALTALGDLARREERFPEAEAAYKEAIGRLEGTRRGDWRLHYAHGIVLERLKRWPEAEAELKEALRLEPDQPVILNYLGYSWVDQGINLDEAKAMLHRAVELRPEDGYILDSLGWAYYRLGEHEKAVTYLERAAELTPADPTVNDHLGDAYWRVGRTREARFQWQRALVFKPEPEAVTQIQGKLERGLDPAPKRG